jgi:plastocyanin
MKNSRSSIAALAFPLIAVLAACGQNTTANTGASGRVVDMDMTDNAFSPKQLQVAKGEMVTLRFHNKGSAVHEAVIGDDAVQASHHQQMTAGTDTANGSMPGSSPMTTTGGGMDHGNMNTGGTTDDAVTGGGLVHTHLEVGGRRQGIPDSSALVHAVRRASSVLRRHLD